MCPLTDQIEQAFVRRGLSGKFLQLYLSPMIARFVQSGCADNNYLTEFQYGNDGQFWSRIWEAMLYGRFHYLGWSVSGRSSGPDLHLTAPTGPALVEATVPSPEGLPSEWLDRQPGRVYSMPHEQMLLRWTSSLYDKKEKHLEDISRGQADATMPFVIAINSCRLSLHPEAYGITQWPFAVEATFPIGPLAVPVDRSTGKFGETYQSLRFSVNKRPDCPIPTDNFLDPDYVCVSALIGCASCHADDATLAEFNDQPPYYLVYNPLATNPLPQNWLPGAIEYAAVESAPGEFTLTRLTPRT